MISIFSKNITICKKNRKKQKKSSADFSEPMFTTFGLTKLICWSWYVFFYISFFKYNTDGIWVWKSDSVQIRIQIFILCFYIVNSLCLHCNSLFLLSFYHYVNLIAFKKQNKTQKKLTCSKYKHHIEWAFKQTCCIFHFKILSTNKSFIACPNKH